jgi:hypothetical protein
MFYVDCRYISIAAFRYGVAFLIDKPPKTQEDGVTIDGQSYCFVGHPTWKELVKNGSIKGSDAMATHISSADWLAGMDFCQTPVFR